MADVTVIDSRRTDSRRRMQRPRSVARELLVVLAALTAIAMVAPAMASASAVTEFPEVLQAPSDDDPVTLTASAQNVITDGTALLRGPEPVIPPTRAGALRGLKDLLTKSRFFPTIRAAVAPTALGAAVLGAFEICKLESIQCWLFEPDQELAPTPTGWNLSPWLVDFTREDGRDGIYQWKPYRSLEFQVVDPAGHGGGSAYWSGDPLCHPNCYPKQLQGLGPLQYTVAAWGQSWEAHLWWFPTQGPASVDTFSSVAMRGYNPPLDPLRLTYRSLISARKITLEAGDDPAVPNAVPGVTVPADAGWTGELAAALQDPANRSALELLHEHVEERIAHLPTCLGMTFQACSQDIRDAGLTGPITRRTLSADDAIMEEDADRVTAINPGGTVKRTDEITVYVNPATLPPMTATETLVADRLEQKNPAVGEEDGHRPFGYETVAKRCVKAAPAAGVNPTDCGSLPIFVTGYDAVVPAANDAAAILEHPSWFMLHRRTNRNNTSWYRSKDGCRDSDYDAFERAVGFGPQCHEYPFWSTHQAHNGLMNDAQPRIMLSSPEQNSTVQGGALQQFYGTPRGFPFPPCNIPAVPDDALATIPEPGRIAAATLAGSAFLNVPIGAAAGAIRTVGLCNDRRAG